VTQPRALTISYQSFTRDDAQIGTSEVISVLAARRTLVAGCLLSIVMCLVFASLTPIFGYRTDRSDGFWGKIGELTLFWLFGAAYFVFATILAGRRLLREPTELTISRAGFRLDSKRASKSYRWIDVAHIAIGPRHPMTPWAAGTGTVLVELTGSGGQPDRVLIPADRPWPTPDVLLELLEEGRAWKVPQLA
jgi:hypothetical protein